MAATLIGLPVFGLLPLRALRFEVENLPKPVICTLRPLDLIADGVHDRADDPTHFRTRDIWVGCRNGVDEFLLVHVVDPCVDVGTSSGLFGLERGYCQMIGGEDATVRHLDPIFAALAPGIAEHGYLRCGPPGAGHFVKMVHNGIEYGLMAAYAEGLSILRGASVGKRRHDVDAETTPLRDPEHYQYEFGLADIAELWRRGSVVSPWLLELTASAMLQDPTLERFAGRVSDSGEGRWTIQASIDEGAPSPVLTAALYQRFSSRVEADFADKVLSAMRRAFGGHEEKKS
jgi:6-phosphogluconate dehydrogenase